MMKSSRIRIRIGGCEAGRLLDCMVHGVCGEFYDTHMEEGLGFLLFSHLPDPTVEQLYCPSSLCRRSSVPSPLGCVGVGFETWSEVH